MSDRNTILRALKEESQERISYANGYNAEVAESLRGIIMFSDTSIRPCLVVWCRTDTVLQHKQDGKAERVLAVSLIGYMDTNDLTDSSELHDFAEAVEYFVNYDFSYKDKTLVDDIIVYEGGASDPAGIFEMRIRIFYEKD